MQVTTVQRHKLKKFIKDLENFRGRHTELVSVYVPAGYDLVKITQHLAEEQGTATNIKSTATRKNVIDALEKMIQHLKVIGKNPEHGLAVFSGNVAEREGQSDVQVWSIEPPLPMNQRLYRCDKAFVLDPLKEMCTEREGYGLIVIDRRDAHIAFLRGKTIIPLVKTHSEVPGKFRAGGQCLVKDSFVQLSDGCLPKIEIVHNPNVVKSVMIKNNFEIQNSHITDKWNVKKNKIYKITTKSPRLQVESSEDHVFFVATSNGIIEKLAKELKVDDYLIMPEKIEIKGQIQKIDSRKYYNTFTISKNGQNILKKKRLEKGLLQKQLAKKINVTQTTISSYEIGKINVVRGSLKRLCTELDIDYKDFLNKFTQPCYSQGSMIKLPIELNESFAQFLGYFMGDGCAEIDRITFFEQDEQVALDYQKKFNKFLNLNSSYKFRESKNYYQIRFTSRPLVRLIKEELPEIKKARDSLIPEKILKSLDKVVAAFLKGFFDAEGYVHSGRGIGLGINNKGLAHQLQIALLRFSILSSLHEYDNRANKYSNNPRFTIDISEKQSLEFYEKFIGFTSDRKSKKLSNLFKTKSDKSSSRQIIISGMKIREIIENAGYNLELFPKVNSFFRNERMMSKQAFNNSILSNIKDKRLYKKLKAIYNHPVLPVKISKIEKSNNNSEMVDISVKNQNFIANCLIVHNSAQRFERLIEGAAKQHYKKVAEYVKEQFLNNPDIKGIIVGGPGPTKYTFVEGNYITDQVKKKIIAIKDLSYTGEFGFQELLDKSEDVLAEEDVSAEKKIMTRFFEILSKDSGKVSYGKDEVLKNIKNGVVEVVLVSESLSDEEIEMYEEEAKVFNSEVKLISTETREGVQLEKMGGIAAILRYSIG